MSTAHTKGHLIVKGRYGIWTEDGKTSVADTRWTTLDSSNDEDNARRLAACWNACEGLPTEKLEISPIFDVALEAKKRYLASVEKQRDELLEALKELLDQDDHGEDEIWVRNKARAAIAKAEGGEA